jgi:hypothetical protein
MTGYSWTISAGGTVSAGGGVNDNSVTVLWNPAAFPPAQVPPLPSAQTVSVNYNDANGCSSTTDVVLNVNVFKIPETGPEYHIENTWSP